MATKNTSSWILWPFVAVWNLLALVLNITGRVLAGILGVGLMIVGIALTMTVALRLLVFRLQFLVFC